MTEPRCRHPLSRSALILAVAAVVAFGTTTPALADAATDVSVTAAPRWGPVAPGSWTPYSVTLANNAGVDIDGEVVLVPRPEPPATPGAVPTTTTRPPETMMPILAIGGRAVTEAAPTGPDAAPGTPRWPTYRSPIALPAGTHKTLTVMVLEAQFGYRAELHDRSGRVLAASQAPPVAQKAGASQARTSLLMLSDVVGADAILEALPQQVTASLDVTLLGQALAQQVAASLDVTLLGSAREFPDNAMHLAGVGAVIIDDFDTATLTPTQLRALGDYVSLGGSLLVTTGAAGSRTLGALPAGLAPLRPTGRAEASLSPLAEIAAKATTATTTVVTGEVTGGRTVLGAPGGPPLVVQSDYGAGRVVELTYDPLAEPFRSDELLRELAWDQGLARSSPFRWGRFYSLGGGSGGPAASEDKVWGPTMATRPWPSWPRAEVGILVLFALAAPAVFIGLRRSRRALAWIALPVGAVLTSVACVAASTQTIEAHETVVEVKMLGADGAVLTTSYRGLLDVGPSERVALEHGSVASTLYSATPVFTPQLAQPGPLASGPLTPVAPGLGGGAIESGGASPALRLPARPWTLRTAETLSLQHSGPALTATLRLFGASKSSPEHLVGTVTNNGSETVRDLRGQIPEGQARLVDSLAPGKTVTVDAPVLRITSDAAAGAAGSDAKPALKLPAPTPEDAATFAVASRAFTGPDQVAVVGATGPPTGGGAGRRVSVAVTVVALTTADSMVARTGGSTLVTNFLLSDGQSFAAFDALAPAGAGPLSLLYQARLSFPGQTEPPPSSVEVYNWTTGAWRSLPTVGHPHFTWVETPVDDAEVNQGLVRVRVRGRETVGFTGPQLLLRSTSAETEAAFAALIPK